MGWSARYLASLGRIKWGGPLSVVNSQALCSHRPELPWPDRSTRFWSIGRYVPLIFRPFFFVRGDISVSIPGFAHVFGILHEQKDASYEAASDGRCRNSSAFSLCWSWVLAAYGLWLAWSSRPVVSYLFHPRKQWSERCRSMFFYGTSFAV